MGLMNTKIEFSNLFQVITSMLALSITLVIAEQPYQYYQRQQQQNLFQRQQAPPIDNNAPYPASGWKPQGQQFRLPERQQQPSSQYGPPPQTYPQQPAPQQPQQPQQPPQPQQPNNQYGPPQPNNQYGPPPTTPEPSTETATDPDAKFQVENIKSEKLRQGENSNAEKLEESVFKNTDRGLYYVYLPDGRLQRVVYTTSADLQNMAYTARVKYEDVDPVAAPIYSAINGNAVLPPQRLILQ